MRWPFRALLVLAVAALAAMHGLDATSTAAHGSQPPTALVDHRMSDHHEPQHDAAPHDGALSRVAMACAAILFAVASVVAVRRAGERLGAAADEVMRSLSTSMSALDALWRPPPARFATCVIRR